MTFQHLAEKPQSGRLVAPALNEDIDNIAVLIDCTLKILAFPINFDEKLIRIPGIAEFTLFFQQLFGVVQTEFLTPLVNGFVSNNYIAFRQ